MDGVRESERVSRLDRMYRAKEKSASIGLGFTHLSESVNGRFAMLGFAGILFKEYYTGQTILEQVGIQANAESLKEVVLVLSLASLALITTRLGLSGAGSPINVDDLPL